MKSGNILENQLLFDPLSDKVELEGTCYFPSAYIDIINHLQVKMRTSDHNTYMTGSHVMQYGDIPISREHLFLYMGSDPENANATLTFDNGIEEIFDEKEARAINQRDADLLYLWQKVVIIYLYLYGKCDLIESITLIFIFHWIQTNKYVSRPQTYIR